MTKSKVISVGLIAALVLIAFLVYDRFDLQERCRLLKQNEIELKSEMEADKMAWRKLYSDCLNENKILISKLKEASTHEDHSTK